MALTIAIEGLGVIANADGTSDSAGGTWGFTGSGGVANGNTTDTYYFGTSSMSMALSGAKNGWLWYNYGSALNFTTTYVGQFIYVWIHCPTIGLTDTLANAGVAIRAGTNTTNFRTWVVAGSNGSNGWDGGWQCFVIDPTKAGSITDTGTYSAATVQYIGVRGATTATAKGDNFFISQIAVGSGLRITGTSTNGWEEAVNYCTDLPNRAWGMLQEREGIYYAYGNINIGSTAMSANCSFVDSARTIQFGVSEYWSGTGTVFNSSLPTTASGITLEDDNTPTTFTTTFTDGVIVGTDNGRSGSTIIGNANENVFLDLSGLTNPASDVNMYGTTFRNLTGSITLANDGDHAYFAVSFAGCSQVNPVGAPVIRNCTFAETVSTAGALLWNENINITDCNFIANTTGAAIEHPSSAGTPYSHDALIMNGNTNDVNNTSGSAITINLTNGANASTSTGSAVTFVSSVAVSVTVLDENSSPVEGATVYLVTSGATVVLNGLTNASGVVSGSYGGATPATIDSSVSGVKHGSSSTPYAYYTLVGSIESGTGYVTTAQLSVD